MKSYSCWRVSTGGSLNSPIVRSIDFIVDIIGDYTTNVEFGCHLFHSH